MKTEPGLKPQAVAGGEPDPHDTIIGKQLCHEVPRFDYRQANLEPILTGIAGAAHEPVRLWLEARHEGQRAGLNSGACKSRPGVRSLNGQEHAV